jgi:hypothetical protein
MTRGIFVFTTAMESTISTSAGARGIGGLQMTRAAILVLGMLGCVWGMWTSGREGLSQMLTGHSLLTEQLEEADRAIKLRPTIPEAHYVRASLLYKRGELFEASKAFERAVALRPRDYALWLELGRARDQANDADGALAAFRESARLAPFYAQPHWQLGNSLLRSGQRNEALAELQRAAASNPKLLPPALNLAWAILNKDPQAVEQALRPADPSAHLALATFFAGHGKAAEAINHFHAAGVIPNEQRRTLLNELLASKNFSEAYAVWSSGRQRSGAVSPQGGAVVADGGFEEPIALDDPGFGWQVGTHPQTVRTSLDPTSPHAGSYSLRVDWNGDSDPKIPIVSQLILVEPGTRYRLSFAARTEDLLTIGLPIVTVVDPGTDNRLTLKQSETFPRGASAWKNYAIEFATTETTRAVQIVIRREECDSPHCAAIGHAWVDGFFLEKL